MNVRRVPRVPEGNQVAYIGRTLLGIEIRTLRKSHGFTLRQLAKAVGLRAHSNIADYELGRRLPPNDIVIAFERLLQVPSGRLVEMRRRALVEEANAEKDSVLNALTLND
jgi:transcriptional regulator with XRE-family HTH domain